MGRFLGDGWFEVNGITISTKETMDAYYIAELIRMLYGKYPRVKLRVYRDGHKVWWIRLWSKDVYVRYKSILGTSNNKSLSAKPPKAGWMNNDAELCFVSGIIDAEGYVYNWYGKLRVALELYNREVAGYIVRILRGNGIKSSLSECRDGAYRIDITDPQAPKLMKILKSKTPCLLPRRVPAVNDAG